MNTLVAVAIAPCGTGDELSAEVAEVVRVIRESGLPNRTTSMFTEDVYKRQELYEMPSPLADRQLVFLTSC